MSNYQPIEGRTMVLNTETEVDFSGVSVADDRPGQYQVFWRYTPSTAQGGITDIGWPDDLMTGWNLQEALNNLNADNPNTIEAVSTIIYNYTSNLLAHGTGMEWESFRDTYRDGGCLRF